MMRYTKFMTAMALFLLVAFANAQQKKLILS